MKKRKLSEQQKGQIIAGLVIVLSISVLLGQVAETRSGFLGDLSYLLRQYIDPIQYMIGLLMINFILVLTAIKKYEKYPNPFLDTLKVYFSILLVNDFLMLILRVIQKSNFFVLKNSMTVGLGKTYTILASARGVVDLTLTSAATLILVYGLVRYSPLNRPGTGGYQSLSGVLPVLVAMVWLVSIPVNLAGLLSGRVLYAWSLGLSQAGQLIVTGLIYWIVKEYHQRYRTRFFEYLTWYYGVSFVLAGLVFTYSMGSFGLMQRFPTGEIEMLGAFGQFVFYVSRMTNALLVYVMFLAVAGYTEPE